MFWGTSQPDSCAAGFPPLSARSVLGMETTRRHLDERPEGHGLRHVLYTLRHTFLTRLGQSGCDVWTLARIAGHSNIKMSMKYVHPDDGAVFAAAQRMGIGGAEQKLLQ